MPFTALKGLLLFLPLNQGERERTLTTQHHAHTTGQGAPNLPPPSLASPLSQCLTGSIYLFGTYLFGGLGGRGGYQDGAHLFKGVIQVGGRTLVPTHLRDRVVREMHRRMGHPGKQRLVRAIESRFNWPRLRRDVKDACSTCGTCNLLKGRRVVNRVVNAPFPIPPTRFAEITLDFASLPPEPDVRGQQFDKVLIIVDRATRFIVALPCLGTDDAATIWRLFEDGYLCRFGPPATALTDRDPIFISSTWRHLSHLAGIRWVYSTAGHAQTDGLTERAIRSIKEELQTARLDNPELTWPHLLQQVVFGHNTTPHTRLGVAPFKLAHGYLPEILPVGLAPPRSAEPDTNEHAIEQRIDDDLDRAHREFSRRQRQDERQHRQSRPFQVTAATEAGAVELDINGQRRWENATNLCPMNIDGIDMQRLVQRLRASQYRDSLLVDDMGADSSDDYDPERGPPVLSDPT